MGSPWSDHGLDLAGGPNLAPRVLDWSSSSSMGGGSPALIQLLGEKGVWLGPDSVLGWEMGNGPTLVQSCRVEGAWPGHN